MGNFFDWLIDLLRGIKIWFVVDPWERAVRVRAGKYAIVKGPGFHWKIPIIDEVYVVNARLRFGSSRSQTVSSLDGKVITIGVQLGFSVTNPLIALTTYQNPECSLSVLVHNHVAQYILDHNSEEIDTEELEDFVISGLKDIAPSDGMQVEFVKVTNLVISSQPRTIRLVQDDIHTDFSSEVHEGTRSQPSITRW